MPKRYQRSRTKGAKQPASCRYCGRGTIYGNDYRITHPTPENWKVTYIQTGNDWNFHTELEARTWSIEMYKHDTESIMQHDRGWIARLKQDLGRYEYLSCFCPLDMPCHVDYLIELVDMPGVFLL